MKPMSTGDGTGAEAAPAFELGGWRCRIVCVDGLLPQHSPVPGSGRIRQCYQPNEVAHFELGAHRWALVAEPALGEPGSSSGEVAPSAGELNKLHTILTNREMQIVQLICNGLLTKQVSDRLRISEFTVRSYLKTIYCKLGVRSRGAMVYAYARSFARLPQAVPPGAAPRSEQPKP